MTAIPAVGTVVTVKVKQNQWLCKPLFYVPEFREYVGTVLPRPAWAPVDVLVISGDAQTKTRWIYFDRLAEISVGGKDIKIDPVATPINRVFQIAGSKGQPYTVMLNGQNWSCDCVGYGFRKYCKHIDQAKTQMTKG